MAKKTKEKVEECKTGGCGCHHGYGHMGCKHMGYGLGFIGAAVYFIGQSTSFWTGVLGFLKAIVWPAFVVFGLLKFLGL